MPITGNERLAATPVPTGGLRFTTELIKGSPEYRVEMPDGTIVARAHCVFVPTRLFSIRHGRPGINVKPEAEAVAYLKDLCSGASPTTYEKDLD